MKLRVILLFVLLAHGVGWAAALPISTNDIALARSQGSNSLASFTALITPRNYHLMGFHSAEEILQATNAEPLAIYTVVHGNLTNYLPGVSFDSLLEPESLQVIIPIMVGAKVRSSTALRLQPGASPSWATVNWGQPRLIRNLMATYRNIPNGEIHADSLPFAVEIPALDIWFIGYYNTQNQLVLRSTVELRLGALTLSRHEIVPESAMFQLALIAQRYNGLPN